MHRRTLIIALTHGLMAAGALSWSRWRGHGPLRHPEPWLDLPRGWAVGASLALGLGLALAAIALSRWSVERTRWGGTLHARFREALGDLGRREALFFALAAGIAEELFFRGVLQVELGAGPALLLFALAHLSRGGEPPARWVPWTLSALAFGGGVALVFGLTGDLSGCIAAHVLVNYENLRFVGGYRSAPDLVMSAGPSVVGSRARVGGLTRRTN